MTSPKTKRNILRIIPYGVIWLVYSIVYTLVEKGIIGSLSYYPSTGNNYNFIRNIYTIPLLALVTGLLIGALEIFYLHKWFIKKSFSQKIFYKSFIYLAIIVTFLIITFVATTPGMPGAMAQEEFWSAARSFFTHYSFLGVMIFIASITLMVQFYTEVSESIGQAVLRNFFTGKYYRPIEEERIFMFLDMKSSTTIAEDLGHLRYFDMLKEYFADLSGPVIDHGGEVYQYAGDEMILSWTLKNGLANNGCLHCFFAMKEALQGKSAKYGERFGLLPKFKAGIHGGKVTTGEIGVLKKEIIFTGDVLNTTARIQGLCNEYQVDLLISEWLEEKFILHPVFESQSMGETKLKGREEKIELFTVLKR